MTEMKIVDLFTDGACKGNPGTGGFGYILKCGDVVKEFSGGEEYTTNNRMELRAVIEGLRKLKHKSSVRVFTDSEYVKRGMTEWIQNWVAANWKTKARKDVANQDLWKELLALSNEHIITWHWIKGHAGHPENERCDALANEYIKKHFY